MRILRYILLLVGLTLLLSGCSFDDLMSSNDSSPEYGEPRERREPTDPGDPGEDEPEDKPSALSIYMPLHVGGKWFYYVDVIKTSNNGDYRITYKGEETWTCTHVDLHDSTFVFETTFTGSKKISNSEEQQEFSESTTATVSAKIKNSALVLSEENGVSISPFLGDWLFLMGDNFRVCFDGDDMQINESTTDNPDFLYDIDKNVGMFDGYLIAASDYEKTEIYYSFFEYK